MRSDVAQYVQQLETIGVNRAHRISREQIWKNPFHRLSILQDIRNAGRTTGVILKHKIVSVVVANQIRAANMDIDPLGYRKPHKFRAKVNSAPDYFFRYNTVLYDFLIVID